MIRDWLLTTLSEHQLDVHVAAYSLEVLVRLGGCSAPEAVEWWCRKLVSKLSEDVERCRRDVRFVEKCFSAIEAVSVSKRGRAALLKSVPSAELLLVDAAMIVSSAVRRKVICRYTLMRTVLEMWNSLQ